MAKLLVQRERVEEVDGRNRVVVEEHIYLVSNMEKDVQTAHGFVAKGDLKKPAGSVVKTNTGKEMILLDASFADAVANFQKLPQTILPKDAGLIIATTGIGKESIVVDAGAGSGALTAMLANVAKHVTAYEIKEEYLKNIEKNLKLANLDNVTLKHGDITKGIEEKNVDLVTLDMPEPWHAIQAAHTALKPGGYVVMYVPTVPQMMQCVDGLETSRGFLVMKSVELIERPWHVEGKKVRPKSDFVGHTAFLIFARRL